MDPIEKIHIHGDSTFALLLEAQHREHSIFYYTPDKLFMRDGVSFRKAMSFASTMCMALTTNWSEAKLDLKELDVIHLRQDPPLDMAYVTTTHISITFTLRRWS